MHRSTCYHRAQSISPQPFLQSSRSNVHHTVLTTGAGVIGATAALLGFPTSNAQHTPHDRWFFHCLNCPPVITAADDHTLALNVLALNVPALGNTLGTTLGNTLGTTLGNTLGNTLGTTLGNTLADALPLSNSIITIITIATITITITITTITITATIATTATTATIATITIHSCAHQHYSCTHPDLWRGRQDMLLLSHSRSSGCGERCGRIMYCYCERIMHCCCTPPHQK
jgi:hypothetical protein